MDVRQTRRANLATLIEKRFNSRLADFARAVERDDAYIWQLVNGERNAGEKIARHIEQKLQLPNGSLDIPDSDDANTLRQPSPASYSVDPELQNVILSLMARLTKAQQQGIIEQAQKFADMNDSIRRELGTEPLVKDRDEPRRATPIPNMKVRRRDR